MKCDGCVEDYSADIFDTDEVHKIAILDLRLLNLDRNEGNILVQTVEDSGRDDDLTIDYDPSSNPNIKRKLIPIDHGMTIPDSLEVCSFDLVWLGWTHADKPFSHQSLDFIRDIDVMKDIKLLEDNFKFRPICLRNMRISNILLKKAAEAGLTLANIGQILCRPDDDFDQPSLLEKMVQKARTCADMMAQV